ncbi:MAG: hypothetical protein ACE5I2_00775 [Anaerolineae bacterium]
MLTSAIQELQETVSEVAWRQWATFVPTVSSARKVVAIIDPEALVLISLALREKERRLWDVLSWWAVKGSTLLSVQRMKNLSKTYPEAIKAKLEEFAYLAYQEGGDSRWKSLPTSPPAISLRSQKAEQMIFQLREAPTLMLRLRSGIGVGIKADVLSVLIGMAGKSASIKTLSVATDYAPRSIRRAVDEMINAQLVYTYEVSPVEYFVDSNKWLELLGIESPGPKWHFVHSVFAFIADVLALWEESFHKSESPYVLSSHLRDVVDRAKLAFRWNQIRIPEPSNYRGVDFLEAFEGVVKNTTEWLSNNV